MLYAVRTEPRTQRRTCNSAPMTARAIAAAAAVRTGSDADYIERLVRSMQSGDELTILPPRQVAYPKTRDRGADDYQPATIVAYEPRSN